MPCPTCDHTMQRINTAGSSSSWFWCPRCGTIREERADGETNDEAPKLVERCREFEKQSPAVSPTSDGRRLTSGRLWVQLGIHESINTPANRP